LHTLNLGILAHVDAGKTSLTERLLFEAGAITELGSVDAGTTRTDSMDVERRRGVTVRTNVASFAAGDVQVNLIDTPGHSDFIAEVERSLSALDAAVLVVSAVEGVQPQTVVLWRVLRRLAVPAAIFINKIDRRGAAPAQARAEVGRRLAAGSGARLLPLTGVLAAGSPGASTTPVPLTDPTAIDVLASGDDRLLRAAVVEPVNPAKRGRLFSALRELAEADPLINLRVNEERGEIAVSLYGEVQKEVIADLLAAQFGVAVAFRPTVTVHIERVAGTGASFARLSDKTTPYLATLGFRVERAPAGSGLACDLEVERGSMPPAFFAATWEGVRAGLAQGLSGWAIPDARVVLTHTGYSPRQSAMHQKFNKNISSVGADFRYLAPVLVHEALRQAGTVVCEPVETFHLEIPARAVPAVTATIARLSGLITGTSSVAGALALSGTLPTRSVKALLAQLPGQTSGEGVFTSEVTHYTPVTGPPPARQRIGPDPLDKEEWFRARPR
jgi:small GTP-binding protein